MNINTRNLYITSFCICLVAVMIIGVFFFMELSSTSNPVSGDAIKSIQLDDGVLNFYNPTLMTCGSVLRCPLGFACNKQNICGGFGAICSENSDCVSSKCSKRGYCYQFDMGRCNKNMQCASGVCGSSNRCIPADVIFRNIGDPCVSSKQCIEGECINSVCTIETEHCVQLDEGIIIDGYQRNDFCSGDNLIKMECTSNGGGRGTTVYCVDGCEDGECIGGIRDEESSHCEQLENGIIFNGVASNNYCSSTQSSIFKKVCNEDFSGYVTESESCAPGICEDGECVSVCGNGVCEGHETDSIDAGPSYTYCPDDCYGGVFNYNLESEEFDALMNDVGIDMFPTDDSEEIKKRTKIAMKWIVRTMFARDDELDAECHDYMNSVSLCDNCLLTPDTMGKVYAEYGRLCHGSCHWQAKYLSNILWKSGVSPEALVIGGKPTANDEAFSHYYVLIREYDDDGNEYWTIVDTTAASGPTAPLSIYGVMGYTMGGDWMRYYKPCTYLTPEVYYRIEPLPDYCSESDISSQQIETEYHPLYVDIHGMFEGCIDSDGDGLPSEFTSEGLVQVYDENGDIVGRDADYAEEFFPPRITGDKLVEYYCDESSTAQVQVYYCDVEAITCPEEGSSYSEIASGEKANCYEPIIDHETCEG